jgi:probable HAF family extracellular repeat protein
LGAGEAYGINNAGQVVGASPLPVGNHAVIWNNGVIQDLGTLPGDTGSSARGINNAGDVVGISLLANEIHAVIWSNGVIQDLGAGEAYGINNAGQVVGASGNNRAFLWSNGVIQDLGTLPGYSFSQASGINDAGQVVGSSYTQRSDCIGVEFRQRAFLWSNGVMQDLGTLPGDLFSYASGINNAGQVVGASEDCDGNTHAVIWSNGVIQDLGTLPGGSESFASAIANNCGRQTLSSIPEKDTRVDAGWVLTYQVTQKHGLEVDDVSLGTRYMAASMNLPYFYLKTTKFPLSRCVLTPDGSVQPNCSATSRLVYFQTSTAGTNPLEIKAMYEIDNISSNPDACIFITQDYQFFVPGNPVLDPSQACEPSETLPCARFKPITSYQFISDDPAETLISINTAQRLQFAVDLQNPTFFPSWAQSELVALDCNVSAMGYAGECLTPPRGTYFIETLNDENPVGQEAFIIAISNGGPGLWDNLHQTFKGQVQEPDFRFGWPPFGPGCQECVHFHWRWSDAASLFGNFGSGKPLLKDSNSTQSVDMAIVRYHKGEEDPDTFSLLIDGESLIGQSTVLWYSATGFQQSDTFFYHGGFFNPSPPRRRGQLTSQ